MWATRAFSSSVLVGMVPIRRLRAKGDAHFEPRPGKARCRWRGMPVLAMLALFLHGLGRSNARGLQCEA